jgi:hypothetical protein
VEGEPDHPNVFAAIAFPSIESLNWDGRGIKEDGKFRRRDGAMSWGIFVDTEAPNAYLENFKVDSWAEHERQHNRFTQADREVEEQVVSYAIKPVEVQHYIYAREGPRVSETDS